MRKSTEIRSDIQLKIGELETLVGTEQRTLSAEENTKFDALTTEIEALKLEETRSISMEKTRKDAAEAEKRRLDIANAAGGSKGDKPEKELRKKFNLFNFMNEVGERNLTGINKELHEEAIKEARDSGVTIEHFGIPSIVLEKRDMTAETDTEGGFTIDTDLKSPIEFLTDNLVVKQLGADFMTGLKGNIEWPREDNNIDATWKAENAAADELSPTYDNVTMNPNRLTAFVDISKQLMIQSSINVQNRVSARLGNASARAIDKAAIQGTGASNQPLGILNTSGIGTVALGTNGAAIDWPALVALVREVDVDNALLGNLNYLTNPLVHAELQTILKATGTAQFLLNNSNDDLNGYGIGYSNHVPSNLTKGTGTDLSAMIFGNFNDLAVGIWGGMDILVNPYTKAKTGQVEIILNTYADVAVLRPQSFAAITDIITT